MSDVIFSFENDLFECFICADLAQIEQRQKQFQRAVLKDLEFSEEYQSKVFLDDVEMHNQSAVEFNRDLPFFFENTQYVVEVIFKNATNAQVAHKLNYINDKFHFNERNKTLTGFLESQNNIGKFILPIFYDIDGVNFKITLSFEILPTKIDIHRDLEPMYQAIDEIYPLWRFNIASSTEQQIGKGNQREYFPLLWLAYFQKLQFDFFNGLKIISQMPHHRLQSQSCFQNSEKIKQRVSRKLEHQIVNDLKSGINHKKYEITQKYLSVDTPENRFIKHILKQTSKQFGNIISKLKQANDKHNKLSVSFFETLENWQQQLKQFQQKPFWKAVGEFHGLNKVSLVLQQKTGYSKVYYIWQELKYYLDSFANHATVSMKSLAEIYEIWCFLTIRNILIEELGFVEIQSRKAKLYQTDFLDYELTKEDKSSGIFYFQKNDTIISLKHEPSYSKHRSDISTFWNTQRPDIVLDIKIKEQQRFIFLFDAKYRIDNAIDEKDFVPEDAINQMHRYRDALILLEKRIDPNVYYKSRPVFGAFALYPGAYNQTSEINPYQTAINEVGIGAFALLPNQNKDGYYWLAHYLKEKLTQITYSYLEKQENLLIQEPSRISYSGMQQNLYTDLTLIISLGNERSKEYYEKFQNGSAEYYHVPRDIFEQAYRHHIINEIKFIALAEHSGSGEDKFIDKIWQIENVCISLRNKIDERNTGKPSNKEDEYYLIKLGKSFRLNEKVINIPNSFRQSIKLTKLAYFNKNFETMNSVYPNALKNNSPFISAE